MRSLGGTKLRARSSTRRARAIGLIIISQLVEALDRLVPAARNHGIACWCFGRTRVTDSRDEIRAADALTRRRRDSAVGAVYPRVKAAASSVAGLLPRAEWTMGRWLLSDRRLFGHYGRLGSSCCVDWKTGDDFSVNWLLLQELILFIGEWLYLCAFCKYIWGKIKIFSVHFWWIICNCYC